eukprot:TRINITY_DN25490_c0_g1_i3.p2 TRINITY_DN25490_c0_g1~~TRINITY_DN25490_c0_g1_i3.p2  ORF type:complete len:270 (-),score=29.72 TRINITY_DN25490_c0_g1_i3:241-1050(-)
MHVTLQSYLGNEHDKAKVRSSGGNNSAGPIYQLSASLGKQQLTTNTTAPQFAFGSEKRQGLASKIKVPGPGTYKSYSTLGQQPLSSKENCSTTRFGSGTREAANKQFISADHEKSSYGQTSPGPGVYNVSGGIGKQILSQREEAPSWKQPTESRFNYDFVKRAKTVPGAGQYGAIGSVGTQTEARKKSLPKYSFGSSNRDHFKKVFLSKDHEKSQYGANSPGPTTGVDFSGFGGQSISRKKTSERYKFGKSVRVTTTVTDTPGPGTYCA